MPNFLLVSTVLPSKKAGKEASPKKGRHGNAKMESGKKIRCLCLCIVLFFVSVWGAFFFCSCDSMVAKGIEQMTCELRSSFKWLGRPIDYSLWEMTWQVGLLNSSLGGRFKYSLFWSLPGEMIPFVSYFSDGLKPPTSSDFLKTYWKTRPII